MDIHQSSKELLSLMQLFSSNLPLGGFSYSQGLESAIESGWIKSVNSFLIWQKNWIDGQLVYLDWPMLKRCYYYAKFNDYVNFKKCVIQILLHRDTYELRLAEQKKGKAIVQLILQWYSPADENWISILQHSGLASIAWLGNEWKISIKNLALGYAYNTLESSVIIGGRLLPFGQNQVQRLLKYLLEFIPDAWNKSVILCDDDLGSNFLLQSIASANHETQYSRLFLS